ncbi:hypothetical protein WN943_002823 [Citrus x changshan-huyou]
MGSDSFGVMMCTFVGRLAAVSAGNCNEEFDITWGDGHGKIFNNGQLLTLNLDHYSGSGFQSKKQYLFGKIDMQLKLVPRNSAGTVTAYYLRSQGPTWDEIDFVFLGNLSGHPYTVHTNVYSQGKGDREQQFHLCFSVDGIPIREFKNLEAIGVPFPKNQPMRIYSSLWNADDWATRGGLIKTDWSQAPSTASYRNFKVDGSRAWLLQQMDSTNQRRLYWVRKNHMIYNYCTDTKRFPQGFPKECAVH